MKPIHPFKPSRVALTLAAAGLLSLGLWGTLQADTARRAPGTGTPVALAAPEPARTEAIAPRTAPDFAAIVERYGPAVVNISVVQDAKAGRVPELTGDPFQDFFRRFQPPVPQRGQGSGFIVSDDGLVLTNAHVVEDAAEVTVKMLDRREFRARVVGADRQTDVAVLRIDAKGLPTVRLGDPAGVRVGDPVLAIGSPFGFENTVTSGIVSAKSRALPDGTYVPFLQTDVAINPGNSGGPLFNAQGEVIGINAQIYSRTGGYQGLAFAIPIDLAVQIRDQLVAGGKVERGRLGVTIQEVSQPLAESFGLDRPRGALVASVEAGSAAARAGFRPGDVILSFDGKPVERSFDLPARVAGMRPGAKATIEVWRDRKAQRLDVVVGAFDAVAAVGSGGGDAATGSALGLTVRPLTQDERRQADLKGGLVVESAEGLAARAGIRDGDVIVSVNGAPVEDVTQLRARLESSGRHLALLVQRGGARIFVPIERG